MRDVTTFLLAARDWVPNNARLPVIFYRQAIEAPDGETAAAHFEALFGRHGWPSQWRDGIYDYDHYHSTAHEILGVAAGTARVVLGGSGGQEIDLSAGDALLLPTGTGHRCATSSGDFLVVGGYPEGQNWDICREAPSQQAMNRMAHVAYPRCDPVAGADGPLTSHWR